MLRENPPAPCVVQNIPRRAWPPLLPSPSVKSMHAGAAAAGEALSKPNAPGLALVAFLVQRVASYYAVGILCAMCIESWGWWFEWTPAFIGIGILIGMNSALSMFGGGVIAWGHHRAYPRRNCLATSVTKHPRHDTGFWPGIMIMVWTSMAELVVQYKAIGHAAKTVWHKSCVTINDVLVKRGEHSRYFSEKAANEMTGAEGIVQDPAGPEDQAQIWMWSSGLILTFVSAILIFHYQWGMTAGLTALAWVLGFTFSFLAIQIGAVTDQTPLTAASKASLLILFGVTSGQGLAKDAQRINPVAGEGLGGVVGATLQIGGVSGDVLGTTAGYPMEYC
ncbi:hypothetical protein DL762_003471 [Monosporascus cannonballus]|uniref:Oligopeptide transporter n=1 Tax=Monosporascus cannonballus TaxID=155416 RepID=A0ABY0HB07_9PEZI|nr:hypothetical protein DL763_006620 [Monosporascus cannonballus]RYO88975.1 hypothetical protein DL762_003471 [Monosporascus cannonballus]